MRLILLVFLVVSGLGCAGKGAVEVAAPPLVERRQEEALAEGAEQVGVALSLARQEEAAGAAAWAAVVRGEVQPRALRLPGL
jgi:hypothetical protein